MTQSTWFDIYQTLAELEGYDNDIDINIEWEKQSWRFDIKVKGAKGWVNIEPDYLSVQVIPLLKEIAINCIKHVINPDLMESELDNYVRLAKKIQEIPSTPDLPTNPWWWEIHEAISSHPQTKAFEAWRLTFKPEHRYISKWGWPKYETCWCFWFKGGGILDYAGMHPSIEIALEIALTETIKQANKFLDFTKQRKNRTETEDAERFLIFMADKFAYFEFLKTNKRQGLLNS